MSILLALLALPILLLLCVLTAYRVPLPASLSGSRDLVAAIAAGLAGAGYLLALSVYLFWVLRRSARALDPILAPLGLAGSGYAGFGRRYTGTVEGWPVEVRYFPAQALRAARLDLVVETKLGVQMAVGQQRPLLDCRDCPRLDLGVDLAYSVYGQDEQAARRLFARPAFRAAADRLMDTEGSPELYLQPERLWFRVRPRRIADVDAEAWLRELVRVASVRP